MSEKFLFILTIFQNSNVIFLFMYMHFINFEKMCVHFIWEKKIYAVNMNRWAGFLRFLNQGLALRRLARWSGWPRLSEYSIVALLETGPARLVLSPTKYWTSNVRLPCYSCWNSNYSRGIKIVTYVKTLKIILESDTQVTIWALI